MRWQTSRTELRPAPARPRHPRRTSPATGEDDGEGSGNCSRDVVPRASSRSPPGPWSCSPPARRSDQPTQGGRQGSRRWHQDWQDQPETVIAVLVHRDTGLYNLVRRDLPAGRRLLLVRPRQGRRGCLQGRLRRHPFPGRDHRTGAEPSGTGMGFCILTETTYRAA
jgi:hypothetical protein